MRTRLCRWCSLTFDLSARAVLAAGVPGDGPGHDPGRVLRSDPPTLPEQAVEAAALAHLLLRGGIRPGAHRPLDLPHRGLLLGAGAGECWVPAPRRLATLLRLCVKRLNVT